MLRVERFIYQTFLWVSIGFYLLAALRVGMLSDVESAKFVSGAFFLLAGVGIAFSRALRNIRDPRWWHWLLGAILILPAILRIIAN
jgi:hypothetical protein